MTGGKKPIVRLEPVTYTYREGDQEKTIDGFTVRHYDPEYPGLDIPYKNEEEKKECPPFNWRTFPQDCMPIIKFCFSMAWTLFVIFFWAAVVGIGVGSW